jgi:hypothetical protein
MKKNFRLMLKTLKIVKQPNNLSVEYKLQDFHSPLLFEGIACLARSWAEVSSSSFKDPPL